MDFLLAKHELYRLFQENDFEIYLEQGLKHQKETVLAHCSTGTEISVSFPGYKAYIKDGKVIYDYRIDIIKDGLKTALSHANIITDIYNKVRNGQMFSLAMSNALIAISKEGSLDMDLWISELPYRACKPSEVLLNEVEKTHVAKVFNRAGNSFNLSLEELFTSIKWIVIQEDINYPISEGFEGRRMSFARYLEAVFVSQNLKYTLADVLERTLVHKRPKAWS
jgi:UDP-N-acetylglucosamine transferase subunit ALG13